MAAVHDPSRVIIKTSIFRVTPVAPVAVAGVDKWVVTAVKTFGPRVSKGRTNAARVPRPVCGGL